MKISKCKNCNYKIFEEQKFCAYCGTRKNSFPLVDYNQLSPELGRKAFFNMYNDEVIDKFTFSLTGFATLIIYVVPFLLSGFIPGAIIATLLFLLYYKLSKAEQNIYRYTKILLFPFFLFQMLMKFLIKGIHFPMFKKRWEQSYWQQSMKIEAKLDKLQKQQTPIANQISFLSQNPSSEERKDVLNTMVKVNDSLKEEIDKYGQMLDMIEINFLTNQFVGRIKQIQNIKTETDYDFEIQEMKKLQNALHDFERKMVSRKVDYQLNEVTDRFIKLDSEIKTVIERLENNRAMLLLEDIDLLEMKMKQKQYMGDLYNDEYLERFYDNNMDQLIGNLNLSEETSARIDAEIDVAKKYLD